MSGGTFFTGGHFSRGDIIHSDNVTRFQIMHFLNYLFRVSTLPENYSRSVFIVVAGKISWLPFAVFKTAIGTETMM